MTEHNLFCHPYASFTNTQLPLLKVAALYFDKRVPLDPVGVSWDTIVADHVARDGAQLSGLLVLCIQPAATRAKIGAVSMKDENAQILLHLTEPIRHLVRTMRT